MRRLWAIAVSLLLAVSVPMVAQHGGGHASGGGHGGFGGHAGGGFSGGHSFSGSHAGSSVAPRSFSRRSSHGPIASRGFNRGFNRGSRGGTNFRIRTYGFRNNCYGYNCGWGYGGWGPYLWGGIDPYWWWDNDSGYDPGQPYGYDNGLANQMQEQGIPLRPPESGDQNYQERHQAERTEAAPATILVFRDQHKQEIHNYAIVGLTLWTFDPQHSQRIPLSDLDLAATAQANDDRGVEFRLPRAAEGH